MSIEFYFQGRQLWKDILYIIMFQLFCLLQYLFWRFDVFISFFYICIYNIIENYCQNGLQVCFFFEVLEFERYLGILKAFFKDWVLGVRVSKVRVYGGLMRKELQKESWFEGEEGFYSSFIKFIGGKIFFYQKFL